MSLGSAERRRIRNMCRRTNAPGLDSAERGRIPGIHGAPPAELVALDLDGTLVDSVPDIAWCIDRTMPRFGIPPRGEALVRTWVGNGVERLVERALTGELHAPADPDLLGEACAAFLDLYSAHGRSRSRIYPAVRSGLAALRAHGERPAPCGTRAPRTGSRAGCAAAPAAAEQAGR